MILEACVSSKEGLISAEKFNTVLRNAPLIPLENTHTTSWQVTLDNNLLYANPNGNAVFHYTWNPGKMV